MLGEPPHCPDLVPGLALGLTQASSLPGWADSPRCPIVPSPSPPLPSAGDTTGSQRGLANCKLLDMQVFLLTPEFQPRGCTGLAGFHRMNSWSVFFPSLSSG